MHVHAKALSFCIISLHCRVKEIVGYNPEDFHNCFFDFLHPSDYSDMMARADKFMSKLSPQKNIVFIVLVL